MRIFLFPNAISAVSLFQLHYLRLCAEKNSKTNFYIEEEGRGMKYSVQ